MLGAKIVELFSISTVTCSRAAGGKETETARRCTLALGGWKCYQNFKIQLQRNSLARGCIIQFEGENEWYGCCSRVNEFTLACLELFHMKPGGVHSRHLPAPNLRHGMLVSAKKKGQQKLLLIL